MQTPLPDNIVPGTIKKAACSRIFQNSSKKCIWISKRAPQIYVNGDDIIYVYETFKPGAKNISGKINKILIKMFFKKKKSLFGTMQKTDLSDLRDHEDRL